MFNLAFAFLLTSFACIVLQEESVSIRHKILPLAGIFICLFLIISGTLANTILWILVILAGIPLYLFFSPKEDIHHIKNLFISEEAIFLRRIEHKNRYLANFIQIMYRIFHYHKP